MKKNLLRRFPFAFLLLLFGGHLLATPECPIITETFSNDANGATVNTSSTGWYLDASNVPNASYFAVKSHRLMAENLGGVGIWYSNVFSTAGYSSFQVAVKITAEGDQNSSEYVEVYYMLNGGTPTLLARQTGNFGTLDFSSDSLTGSNVQLMVKIYDYDNGGTQTSKYYIEQYRVFKEKGPCAGSIVVSAGAGNGGVVTCSNTSVTLTAGTTATGTTTYSWTGPNGFSSALQSPSVSTPGTYTVVGTNPAGSGSASITVTQNTTPPDVTATGASLACASSVTIGATSSVSNATYAWTGPDSFSSATQSPTVSTAGTYTVTVTNPANGCTASQSVTVAAGSAQAATLYLEDFTLADGTTSDTGSSAWSGTNTSSGTFAVSGGAFEVNNIGTATEGVWTSGNINISGETAVTASLGVRSAVSSGGALESSGSSLDYVRMYYKVDGGSEVLFGEKLGAINNNNATNTLVTSGVIPEGSNVQIVIRARTTASDEFYYFDNVQVTGVSSDTSSSTITTSVSGMVTCTNTAQLFATASGTATGYSWTGPNGFTSTDQNPVVSSGGQYIVTASVAGGCSVSAAVTVPENKTAPDITASGGVLACLPSVTLNVSSSVAGATYSWTGPGNFTSTARNPSVSAAGTYTATATDTANGCTASQAVQVSSGSDSATAFWLEDFNLPDGTTVDSATTTRWTSATTGTGTYSVQSGEFKTSFSGAAVGTWTSGVIDISKKKNVVLSVDLRSETASSGDYFETDDYIEVDYILDGVDSVVYLDVAGIGSTTNTTASTTVSSAPLNGSTLQIVIKTRNSDPTERYYFDNVTLTGADQGSADATASATGILTCSTNSVTLSGSSSAGGAAYSWSGPDNFSSTGQNPVVTAPGVYTLTITDPSTGCTGTDTAIVIRDTTGPGAAAGVSEQLTCARDSVLLSGSSATAGVTYAWTGPDNFASALQDPFVGAPGTYTLTVTDGATGCSSAAPVDVAFDPTTRGTQWLEDFTLANGATSDTGSTAWSVTGSPSASIFSVQNNAFEVSNSGTTGEGVWRSAVMDISGKTNVSISAGVRSSVTGSAVMNTSGTYMDYLRFYYKLDGGSEVLFDEKLGAINDYSTTNTLISIDSLSGSTLQIIVRARATGSDEFYYFDNVQVIANSPSHVSATAGAAGVITCTDTTVTLLGSSIATGAVYSWSGPGGYSSSLQNPVVNAAGAYSLTVTNAAGCSATDSVVVLQNTTAPAAASIVTIPASAQLTCTNSSVSMTDSSASAGVGYLWTGPGGFTESSPTASASAAGDYTLTVIDTANGCHSANTVTITANTTKPADVVIATIPVSAQITCADSVVSLSGSSSTGGVQYSWAGPGGYASNLQNPSVNAIGNYILTVTDTANGCAKNDTVSISQNKTAPDVSASNTNAITCSLTSSTLLGNSGTSGVTYSWTGPGNYSSAAKSPSVTAAGTYTLTVTSGANGCFASANTVVQEDNAAPDLVVSNDGPLTCTITSVTISAMTSITNPDYFWTGPNDYYSFSQQDLATDPGDYVLTLTNLDNGCYTIGTTTVGQDLSACSATRRAVSQSGSATDTTADLLKGSAGFTFRAYPNPFSDRVMVEFESSSTVSVNIRLYNNTGLPVKDLQNGSVEPNRLYQVAIDTHSLAAGIYHCVISVNGKIYTAKLLLVR